MAHKVGGKVALRRIFGRKSPPRYVRQNDERVGEVISGPCLGFGAQGPPSPTPLGAWCWSPANRSLYFFIEEEGLGGGGICAPARLVGIRMYGALFQPSDSA